MKRIRILALSGSLRKASSNRNILLAAIELAPAGLSIRLFGELEQIPPFNPDKEEGTDAVRQLRQWVKEADGVLICTPEYAFGVPGALKNALDWLVSSGELDRKPTAAISASPLPSGGDKAMASLLLTLKALGTKMDASSSLCIPSVSKKIAPTGQLTDDITREQIRLLLENLSWSIRQ